MLVNFSRIDFDERPILILKNAAGSPITVLGHAYGVSAELHFNETSVLEFSVPAYVDGMKTPGYDEIVGLREVELLGVGAFKLVNPVENGEGVKIVKQCRAYSMEYEFAFKKITIPKGTYNFYSPANPDETIVGMILAKMPSWKLGSISNSLIGKYRTFEVPNENIYNFIKGTAQKSYNCIFDFDTLNREIHIIDADADVDTAPLYFSPDNLSKEIIIEENTEGIVTRLDVNGADGVDIRLVNPDGTNKIIILDYYMNEVNFPPEMIEKYYTWKETYSSNRQAYYTLAMRYTLLVSRKVAEQTQLTELKNELSGIENELAVEMQAFSQKLEGVSQATIDAVNARIDAKKGEIEDQQLKIETTTASMDDIIEQLADMNEACSFESYFTDEEMLVIDRYIKDDDITESTFVATDVVSYADSSVGTNITNTPLRFSDVNCSYGKSSSQSIMRSIRGGQVDFGDKVSAQVISAVLETRDSGNTMLMNARLGAGTINGIEFPSGTLTVDGTFSSIMSEENENTELDKEFWVEESNVLVNVDSGYMHFTLDTSDYEKYSVAWDLYEYGLEVADRLAQPSYTFSISSANFMAIDKFIAFKNKMRFGKKMYIEDSHKRILYPICIGLKFEYDDKKSLELQFGDSFLSSDSSFKMVDLLEQSVSMGKNVDASKFVYASFVDSGANTGVKELMESAIDVSKNAIMSSGDQAPTWDATGIRLRKWTDDSHTAYEDEQVWMNNNSIMLTSNGWQTAQMAIGKFYDPNVGPCWGIIAPYIVGTLLAGSELVIESAKKDGNVAVFKMDGDGCRLYNSQFTINNGTAEIMLNPEIGIAIGASPLIKDVNGKQELDTEEGGNAKFWVDADGNVHIKGTLHGVDGDFSGTLNVADLKVTSKDSEDNDVEKPFIEYFDNAVGIKIKDSDEVKGLNGAVFGDGAQDGLVSRVDAIETDMTPDKLIIKIGETSEYKNAQVHIGEDEPENPSNGKLWIDTSQSPEVWKRYIISEVGDVAGQGVWYVVNNQEELVTRCDDIEVWVGQYPPDPDENGKIPEGKLWVDTKKSPEVWKRYSNGEWSVINDQSELKSAHETLAKQYSEFTKKMYLWFTFDYEKGLTIRKPDGTDEDGNVIYDGSAYYTVTDNNGYHIYCEKLDDQCMASFEYDRLIINKVQVGDTLMQRTHTGGIAFRASSGASAFMMRGKQ